jgi:gas vesicle protein
MTNNNNRGSGLLAFLLGGAIGAAIGLLYAPRSGKETREILIDEGDEMVNKAVSSIRTAQDKAMSMIQDAQSRVETLNKETNDRIQKLQEIARDTMNEQKESVKKGYSKAKEVVTE